MFFCEGNQSQHHTGKNCLDGLFFIARSGEGQGDTGICLFDPDLGLCATYIIDGGFSHSNNCGDGSTDDVAADLGIAAVTGNGEARDSVIFREKFASSHNYSAILVISTLV